MHANHDEICSKCERHVARKQVADTDHQPVKKQKVNTVMCFLNKFHKCESLAVRNTNIFDISQFCHYFEIEKENFHSNQPYVGICNDHFLKYNNYYNSCEICFTRFSNPRLRRKIPLENHKNMLSYLNIVYPNDLITLTGDTDVCSQCYFLSHALKKSSKSTSTDKGLNDVISKSTTFSSIYDGEENIENAISSVALNKCVIFVANKFLNGEPILVQTVLDLYESYSSCNLSRNDEASSSKIKYYRWLMSSLTTSLADHIEFHRLPSHKLGIMLFRKGSNILSSLHHILYKNRLAENKINDSACPQSTSLTYSDEALLFEAAMALNNILISKACDNKMASTRSIDISKVSLANMISDTDPRLWNFVYLFNNEKIIKAKSRKRLWS